MKKYSIIFILTILSCYQATTQETINDVMKGYFRSDPFDKDFSKFLDHLLNDPTLINKTLIKRTDTNFFYFKGQYTQHNPFSYKAIRTEVILAETEIQIADSIPQTDTILLYQLLGYTKGGKQGNEETRKEFNKFKRKFGNYFWNMDSKELTKNNQVVGTISDFYSPFNLISPLTIAWAMFSQPDENVFAITIRIKVKENTAMLPETPDRF